MTLPSIKTNSRPTWPLHLGAAVEVIALAMLAIAAPSSAKSSKVDGGRAANKGELAQWSNATPERRGLLCPVLWAAPFGVMNVMRRAIPLTFDQHRELMNGGNFPRVCV